MLNTRENQMNGWSPTFPTALLMLRDGRILYGKGIGATGHKTGEVCFNTAMTGYQEIMSDPSYAEQIITFTFPHIGNIGTNHEDIETTNFSPTSSIVACGIIIRESIPSPANYRSTKHLDDWLKQHNLIGLCDVDTRSLVHYIREHGTFDALLAHHPTGSFDIPSLRQHLDHFSGIENMDLAKNVSTQETHEWIQGCWTWGNNFHRQKTFSKHVVAIDYGIKSNILRCLANTGCRISVVSTQISAEQILAMQPDGIFLSNGPGDPAATAKHAVPKIKKLLAHNKPIFGICLGHQILALAVGAKTIKMRQGHHGANHPVQDLTTGKVEITSMNHNFTLCRHTLPDTIEETHISLFDKTNCGIRVKNNLAFSVQYHPEASPGPQDSHYLFDYFMQMMET